jgi:AraC-like DNA-binding protein
LSIGRYPQTAVLDPVTVKSKQLQLTGRIEAFGILFQPAGAYPLFGLPMPELTDIEAIPGHIRLYEQLYETPTLAGKVSLVENWLTSLLAWVQLLSPLIHPSLKLLAQTAGRLTIQHLAETLYITPRQLERLYQQQVGLSPKKYAQLQRVHLARTALKALKQGDEQSLAQTAHHHGYHDQAHFIREFKTVTGLTPGQYLARHQQRQGLLQSYENHPL